jgi:aryl carrier-like protein
MAIGPKDKKALLPLLEHAQLVYLLSRYPKKQVLDDPKDVERLQSGLDAMRAAAKGLSSSLKEAHAMIPWDELAERPDTTELAWRRAKRIAPTVIRELTPLLEGEPEAAFFLRPEAPAKKTAAKKTAKAGAPDKRRSQNGSPSRRG